MFLCEDVEKMKPLCTVSEQVNGRSMEVPLKIKNNTTLWPSHATFESTQRNTPMVTAAIFIIPKL